MYVRTKLITIISLILACFYASASQQTEPVELEIDVENVEVKNIEVITVTGRRSLGHYRRALRLAEKDLYKEYSKLTDIDEFKITCATKQRKLDSRLKSQVCAPRFEKTFQTRETQFQVSRIGSSLNGTGNNPNSEAARAEPASLPPTDRLGALLNTQSLAQGVVAGKLRRKKREHYEDMLSQLQQHPELREKLVEFVVAKQKYALRAKSKSTN